MISFSPLVRCSFIVATLLLLSLSSDIATAFASTFPQITSKLTTRVSAGSASALADTTSIALKRPVLLAGGESSFTSHQAPTKLGGPERAFIALKPDAYERRLVGKIISRIEEKGFDLVGMKLIPTVSLDDVEKHYEEHQGKPFYGELIDFFRSGPIVAMVWEGDNVISILRKLVGATQPIDALPGTIRGDYCFQRGKNLIHCSDSPDSAQKEIAIWFPNNEHLMD